MKKIRVLAMTSAAMMSVAAMAPMTAYAAPASFRIPGKGESVLTVFPVGVAEADRHFRHARFHLKLEFPQPERPAQFITCGDIFPAVSKIGGELERIRECP